MLTVHQISKSYGIQTVLSGVSFSLSPGERLGFVGPNGSGKTTLLRILTGDDRPDSGSVQFDPPDLSIGYLPQGLNPASHQTIQGYLNSVSPDLPSLSGRLESLAARLAERPDQPDLQRQYDAVLVRLQRAAETSGRLPAVLAALELDTYPPDTPVAHLSGGQKTRLALAAVLLSEPQLLILDEPTNHLDLEMLVWLEDWLAAFRSAALVVSHDRAFLDRVTTGILELDPETHRVRKYAGNYSAYLEEKVAERERHWQAYQHQQEEITRLQAAVRRVEDQARFKRGGKGDSGDKFAKGFFANRSTKGTLGRARQIEKRVDRLLGEERIEKPRQSWQMKLEFGEVPAAGREVLWLEDLTVGYPGVELLRGINLNVVHGERVVLMGKNGSGKTTLLRTVAGRIPPLQGRFRLGSGVRIGYMTQEQENLAPESDPFHLIRALAPLAETEARTFLHRFLFAGDEVFTPINKLSFGERARLALAVLVAQGCNFLMLDEPINHLDIPSRARFEDALRGFDGTVLAVVHDRYFVANFATQVWQVEGDRVQRAW